VFHPNAEENGTAPKKHSVVPKKHAWFLIKRLKFRKEPERVGSRNPRVRHGWESPHMSPLYT